jgi:dTDP-4-amino-4,6-dideoxygalactose transaminase
MIKFVDLSRCWNELKHELLPAYEEIHQSGNVANGKYRKLVEEQLKDITGRKNARLTTSGTTAIQGSLIAWDLINKDVACSNYSYVASTNQAALLNKVQLHDVDEDGNISLASAINVDAVIPVSLFGNSVDYDLLRSKIGNAKMIADCAQSLGSTYKGKPDGSIGDCSVFSFATNKPVPTAGTQGAVVWDDDAMSERVEMAFNNGKMSRNTPIRSMGVNGNAFELQAAQIHFGLKRLQQWQDRRTQISTHMMSEFKQLPIKVITAKQYCESNWHKFVIKSDLRDGLYDHLRNNNIDAQKHYTDDFNLFFGNGHYMANTKVLCDTVLSVPNNQWLTDDEVEYIIQTVKEYYNR